MWFKTCCWRHNSYSWNLTSCRWDHAQLSDELNPASEAVELMESTFNSASLLKTFSKTSHNRPCKIIESQKNSSFYSSMLQFQGWFWYTGVLPRFTDVFDTPVLSVCTPPPLHGLYYQLHIMTYHKQQFTSHSISQITITACTSSCRPSSTNMFLHASSGLH